MKSKSSFTSLIFTFLLLSSLSAHAKKTSENYFATQLGLSQQEVDNKINSLWKHFFTPGDFSKYEQDGQKSVYYEVNDSMAFILDTGSDDVRTEGMSYGMMICVQLNHRKEFDKLWHWAKRYMAYPADSAWDGYFCWQCKPDGTTFGQSNASDGEIYFVTALLLAADKWNNPEYAREANEILKKIQDKDGEKTGIYPMFDKKTHLVTFVPTEEVHWFGDPSYCLPAFLDYWSKKATTNRKFWKKAAKAARQLLVASSHPVTGLYPDYSLFDGSPYSWPKAGYNTGRYMYDAIRCPMNVGMDYYLTGKDRKRQQQTMHRLLQFFKNDQYRHAHYDLDGTHGDDGYTEGMTGANAVGALALLNGSAQDQQLAKEYLMRLWNVQPPTGKWRYYVGMVYFLSMLHVSGNFSL